MKRLGHSEQRALRAVVREVVNHPGEGTYAEIVWRAARDFYSPALADPPLGRVERDCTCIEENDPECATTCVQNCARHGVEQVGGDERRFTESDVEAIIEAAHTNALDPHDVLQPLPITIEAAIRWAEDVLGRPVPAKPSLEDGERS